MSFIQNLFDSAGELYGTLFADWLHIHFLIRTVIILLLTWLVIFLLGQVVKYVIAPGALMFFYRVPFRIWNYFFVETPHEYLYVRHHNEPEFPEKYLQLCDKVKHNRTILEHTRFRGMIIRSKKFSTWFMLTLAVVATLWVSAFGLYHEYSAPAAIIMPGGETVAAEPAEYQYDVPTDYYYDPADVPTASPDWEANDVFVLNERGREGARLRSGPGIDGEIILEMLWDDAQLVFSGEYLPDAYVNGLYWLRVQTETGTVGYISSMLVNAT
ncbi:MAG: SH3 domain-containing protein [Defluviitaleaceae bacterium]|nr:SH3 domain-containing protein [Defluviitaleaceae bacterium]